MPQVKAPAFPESVSEGTIAALHKQVGESFAQDELLIEVETDKIVLEVAAPFAGAVDKLLVAEGDVVSSQQVLAEISAGGAPSAAKPSAQPQPASAPAATDSGSSVKSSPAARRLASEQDIDLSKVASSQKSGVITKQDVAQASASASQASSAAITENLQQGSANRPEERVPMSRLRQSIAKRLVQAQQTAAMLTTFNEINMQPVMSLRAKYKDEFERTHGGVRLGFMSFFVKAATEALKRYPAVNASIDGNEIVYHGYQDIGVAVSSDRGLVVPVLRSAESMSLAEIEAQIRDYGAKAQSNKLSIEQMQGGTFTISNGGVFGSLLSTPILNPPQTAILGMHKIQERPVAENGQVVIRPMMYLALSYDHRMIDGKEAVQFLVAIKNYIEDPARLVMGI